MHRHSRALLCAMALLSAACSTSIPSDNAVEQDGSFHLVAHSTTRFEAIYTQGEQWLQARVEYTPVTTLYELKSSLGTTLIHEGTAFMREQKPQPDPRTQPDGRLTLTEKDPEYALVLGLHQQLLELGASDRPTPAEKGSTLYAAAYMTARVLGYIPANPHAEAELTSHEGWERATAQPTPQVVEMLRQQRWPYPGYDDARLMPAELKLLPDTQLPGAQNYDGGVTCCGPYACVSCGWSSSISCDDWCAAGDHCNQYHPGSGCGTASFWPSGGVNGCPHSDGSAILAYGTGEPYYNHARNYCYDHYTGYWNDCWSANGLCW
jgi:hypothetical protein